jgi:hypothetical protein
LEAVYVEQCPIYIEDDHLPIDVRRDCCHIFPCGVQVMTPPMLLPCRSLRLSRFGSLHPPQVDGGPLSPLGRDRRGVPSSR